MGERLAAGNVGIALLANTAATGAMLFVLITIFGPISGAHLNPAVSAVAAVQRNMTWTLCMGYIAAQLVGAVVGVFAAHAMFELPIAQVSLRERSGAAQLFSEFVATFGLITTIVLTARYSPSRIAAAVAGYIMAAYWFTASTSFANPAVTMARSVSDTFTGVRPLDAPAFILAQLCGAVAALWVTSWILRATSPGKGQP
jgi:glycerol uptake facilitator-like aquaporin